MAKIRTFSEVVMRGIDDITPYWNNPRLNDKTREALVDVFREIGFNQPILIDRGGTIIKGHARFYAAKVSGFKELPCIVSRNSEKSNREDRLLDNSIQDLSEWDPVALILEASRIDLEISHLFSRESIRAEVNRAAADLSFPEDKELELTCPKCGKAHTFSQGELLARENYHA